MQQQLEIIVTFRKGGQDALPQINQGAKSVMNSIDGLNTKVKYYEDIAKKAEIGSKQYANAIKQVELAQKQASTAQLIANKNMMGSTRQTAQMTMTMQAMNFTIRDSPYFFRDFSLGILAVGNNLNPLIDGLINVKREAKLAGSTLGKEMMKSLKGPGGLIFAFSVLVSVMQAVVFAMDSYNRKTKEAKEKTDKLADAVDSMTRNELNAHRIKHENIVRDLEAQKKQFDAVEAIKMKTAGAGAYIPATFSREEELKASKAFLEKLALELTFLSDIYALERKIKQDREKYKATDDPVQRALMKKQLDADQAQLDAMMLKEEKEKKLKVTKTESYILTEQQMRQELAILEVLKQQATSALDRFHYTQQIAGIEYDLMELSRLPDPSEGLGYQPGEFTGKKGRASGVEKIAKVKPELGDVNKELQTTDMLATRVGTSLYQAFLQGKLAIDELAMSLVAVAAQLVIIEGLKYIFSGGISGLFGSPLSQGGIVKASGGYMTTGNGSHDYIPAMLRPGEMVINPNQQQELFNMVKGMGSNVRKDGNVVVVLQGTLDGQQFIKKTIKKNNALLR